MLEGNDAAKRAHDVFCYRITKFVGGYIAALNGVDAITFTGGIGENSPYVRKDVLAQLSYLGLELSEEANMTRGTVEISTPESKVKAYVIPTNEELQMVREATILLADD